MLLTRQQTMVGRQLKIAGAILVGSGLVTVAIESTERALRWDNLALVIGLGIALIGGLYAYQRSVYWNKLRQQLLAAPTQASPPAGTNYRPPAWLWIIWALLSLGLANALGSAFGILAGCMLIGYGLAAPDLARKVAALEAGRVQFYSTRNPATRRPEVVRVAPDGAEEEA